MWNAIVLVLLQTALAIMEQIGEAKGRDEEIARAAQAVLAKTLAGKKIMDRINALTDEQVDAELNSLEPK